MHTSHNTLLQYNILMEWVTLWKTANENYRFQHLPENNSYIKNSIKKTVLFT
jgi:hypothetical protein